jgi:streptomycin 6-kinase
VTIPESLAWMRGDPATSNWLASAADRFAALLDTWDLVLDGAAFEGGSASLVAPVRRADGSPAVLKLQWPHEESTHEAAALAAWQGRGAVRLLDWDAPADALLIERCTPGDALDTQDHAVILDELLALVPQLWRTVDGPFDTQADTVRAWAAEIEAARLRIVKIAGDELLDRVPHIAEALAVPQGDQLLAHQDLHPGNVVRARGDAWLAIDPKPLVGDRECGAISIVRSSVLGYEPDRMRSRLDRVVGELELDRTRMRDLAVLQLLAWSTSGPEAERDRAAARTLAAL